MNADLTPTIWWTDDQHTLCVGFERQHVAFGAGGAVAIIVDGERRELGTLTVTNIARAGGWLLGAARVRGPGAALDALEGAALVPPCPKCHEPQPCRCIDATRAARRRDQERRS